MLYYINSGTSEFIGVMQLDLRLLTRATAAVVFVTIMDSHKTHCDNIG